MLLVQAGGLRAPPGPEKSHTSHGSCVVGEVGQQTVVLDLVDL